MSAVTDTILLYGLAGDDSLEGRDWLLHVNQFFNEDALEQGSADGAGFVHVKEEGNWYGGSKALQANVAIGAFNHLHLPSLVDHIRGLGWNDDWDIDWCQIVAQGEWNSGFELIDVFRHDPGYGAGCGAHEYANEKAKELAAFRLSLQADITAELEQLNGLVRQQREEINTMIEDMKA